MLNLAHAQTFCLGVGLATPHFGLPFTFTSVRGVVTKLRWHARAVGARALAIIRDNLHSRFQILIRSLQLCSIFGNILLPVMSF